MKRKHTKQPAAQVPAPQPRRGWPGSARSGAGAHPAPGKRAAAERLGKRPGGLPPTKTVGQIVRENVFTFFNFIFVVLAALLVAVGSFDDMLFLLIAVANTGIGIVQRLRSKQTVDKLNLLAAPRANVVREGEPDLRARRPTGAG